MERIRKTKDFGAYREVENICAPMLGNHNKRMPKARATANRIAKLNDRHSAERCEDKIKANFDVGDWFVTLTYDDMNVAADEKAAKKDIRNFFERLSRKCDKLGITLKYCKTTEQGSKNKRWHHHIILPGAIPYEVIEKVWKKGGIFPKRLRAGKHGYLDVHNLAEYFVGISKGKRESCAGRKRYSFSHNCVAPKITYESMSSTRWLKMPRAPQGWCVLPDSVEEYTDAYSVNYQRYILVKKE